MRGQKKVCYMKKQGMYWDILVYGDPLYSIFFVLCSINKKEKNFDKV
jgi:hypothetical protein